MSEPVVYEEVDRNEYVRLVHDDGYVWEETELPLDEYLCSDCDRPIAYVLKEYDEGGGSTSWVYCFLPKGKSMLEDYGHALCEDCVPEGAVQ